MERQTEYEVIVSKTALDFYGIPLSDDFGFKFWTRNRNEINIVRSFPVDSKEDISTKMIFAIEFNGPLAPDVQSSSFILKDESGGVKRIKNLIVYNEQVRFEPSSELTPGMWYHLTILPTIEDIYGLNLEDTVYIDFKTELETFAGNVFEDFELTQFWESPNDNNTTTGVVSKDTYFIFSSNRKVNDLFSGALYYRFSGESGGICRLINTEKFPTTDNSESMFGMWVFGDFSGNILEFWFEKGGVENEVPVDTIDWIGWKFVQFPMNVLSGSSIAQFHSIVIRQVDGAMPGEVVYFDDAQYDVVSGLEQFQTASNKPETYELFQNYPNPFNPETTIRYRIPVKGLVRLVVYDILGKKIATLVDEELAAGEYNMTWNAGSLPTGVYFYRLEAPEFIQTKKLILIK